MSKISVLSASLLIITAFNLTSACEPCPKMLSFTETSKKADLIIIGQRTDYSKAEKSNQLDGPDTVQVRILRVLKGALGKGETITVNSWDGMCSYGIVVDDKTYVMFLRKKTDLYDTVEFGCSVKTYPVEGDRVIFEGQRLSLPEFAAKLEK